MAVFRAKTRDDISRSEKLRRHMRDAALMSDLRALERKIAEPMNLKIAKPTEVDDSARGTRDATAAHIRAINDANAKYWGNPR